MKREHIVLSVAAATILMLSGCHNSSSSPGSGGGTEGSFTIETTGGNSSAGTGGSGRDTINITSYGANIKIKKTGTVDANFTVPANNHVVDLGSNGAIFTQDTHIPLVTSGIPEEGSYYTTQNSRIYQSDGDSDLGEEAPVTGIQVNEGVTLTLGLNQNYDASGGDDSASYNFDNDVIINGTLKTDDLTQTYSAVDLRHNESATTRDKGTLSIVDVNGTFIVGPNGKVDTSGDDGAIGSNERGGDGGKIYIQISNGERIEGVIDASGGNGDGEADGGDAAVGSSGNSGIMLVSYGGSSFDTGSSIIDASGGDGYSGGSGANITVNAYADLYNAGKIDSNGGDGNDGVGVEGPIGDAGNISMSTILGSLYNSGDIFANGGNGANYAGGHGATVELTVQNSGNELLDLYNSGNITVNGGDSSDQNGGNAGGINLDNNALGGDFRNSGNLYANGGNGDTNGGSGGGIQIEAGNYITDLANNMSITGDIQANGGEGKQGQGGVAGQIELRNIYETNTGTFSLVGYSAINVSGGDGTNAGGVGGFLEVNMYADNNTSSFYNEVDIYGHGGDATSEGKGGSGGSLDLGLDNNTTIENTGSLYFNGGSSIGTDNSNGGNVYMYGTVDNASNLAGMITVEAGTGGTADTGTNGAIKLNGTDVTPPDGTLP